MSGYGNSIPNAPMGFDGSASQFEDQYVPCAVCGVDILTSEVFDVIQEDARKLDDAYVHEACSRRHVARSLNEEERFQMARLVAALRVIDSIPEDLLCKLDMHQAFDALNLSSLRTEAVGELGNLYSNNERSSVNEREAFAMPRLLLVRESALLQADKALLEAEDALCTEIVRLTRADLTATDDIKRNHIAECARGLVRIRFGLRKATHA